MVNKQDWNYVPISDIAEVNKNSLKSSTPKDFEFDYIDIASITRTGIIENTKRLIFEEAPSRARRSVHMGDTIISTVRPYLKAFAFINKNYDQQVCSTGFAVLTPKETEVDPKYLYQTILSDKFVEYTKSKMTGSNYPAINASDVKDYRIYLPPLQEQKKIASILVSVDKAIETTEVIVEQTEKVKRGLMQQLLTRGIGHTNFKKTEIGEIPEEWKLGTLKDYSEHITKGATPTTYGFDWVEEGVLFLRNECVKETGLSLKGSSFISEEAHMVMKRSIINRGDILITITGNLGQCCIYDKGPQEANINQHIARVRIIDKAIHPKFVRYFLNSDFMRKKYELIKTGLAYPQLSLKQIQDIVIPIPSIEEQQQIVNILSSLEKKIGVEQLSLTQLQDLKRGLMQSLLTGKVRVKFDETEVTQGDILF